MRCLLNCLLIVIVCLIALTTASKYSKYANDKKDIDINYAGKEKPFRMQKVNLLWTKARKKLPTKKLADLHAELTVHDRYESQLKKARASNTDKDGALEAKVLKSYARIVEHFGLDDSFSIHDSNEIPYSSGGIYDTVFEDNKLQSMWRRAIEAGFKEKDLEMLREEFQHHQMKINELRFIHRELKADPSENLIDLGAEEEYVREQDLTEEEMMKVHEEKKQGKTAIREGYAKLENLVSSLPRDQVQPRFNNDRVHRLWALAKKTNWTEEELDSFKEELKHFEGRLEKQAFYRDQLDQSSEAIKARLEAGEALPEKHQKLEEKTQFLDRMVNKLYSSLKTKIDKNLNHIEL